MTLRRLLLLGGGHAHVHLLARAARSRLSPAGATELVLVSPHERQLYSGMVPGFLQGSYAEGDLSFDLPALAAAAGARWVQAPADRIDVAARTVEAGGERIDFDLLSLDVGSAPAGLATRGVSEHALTVRPMSRAVALRQRAEELFAAGRDLEVAVTVVGGGAAGVEVALALERLGRERSVLPRVTIVEATAALVPEFSPRVRRIVREVLAQRGVRVATGQPVTAVESEVVELADATRLRSQLTVWIAGAGAPELFARSDLPKDARGFLLVDATLRAVDGSPVFGAGDCIGLAGFPHLAKAGVYAVRQAPILDFNLRAALTGGLTGGLTVDSPRLFRPQRSFLALLNSADGRAIWRWHGLAGHSRLAWWLKDRIDRGFMQRYQERR